MRTAAELYSAIFYSVGGGFVVREGEDAGHSALKEASISLLQRRPTA